LKRRFIEPVMFFGRSDMMGGTTSDSLWSLATRTMRGHEMNGKAEENGEDVGLPD